MGYGNFTFRLAGIDKNCGALIADKAIAPAAGYAKWRYVRDRYYSDPDPRSTTTRAPGVVDCHNGVAHWYVVDGQIVTHPHSAQHVGHLATQQKRTRVPGWHGAGTSASKDVLIARAA
jgi:hypothetical protein